MRRLARTSQKQCVFWSRDSISRGDPPPTFCLTIAPKHLQVAQVASNVSGKEYIFPREFAVRTAPISPALFELQAL